MPTGANHHSPSTINSFPVPRLFPVLPRPFAVPRSPSFPAHSPSLVPRPSPPLRRPSFPVLPRPFAVPRSPSFPVLPRPSPPIPRPFPIHSPPMPRLCLVGYKAIQKNVTYISEGFGVNHYSLFGGFPDGAGFPLQSFLRQKRISAPIPTPRRLQG